MDKDELISNINKRISNSNFVLFALKYNNSKDANITLKCEKCGSVKHVHVDDFYPSKKKRFKCESCEHNDKITHCMNVAKTYMRRSVFADKSPYEYGFLRRNHLLDEACSHMEVVGNRENRCVYSYKIHINNEKYVYVGLTYDIKMRDVQHHKKGTLYNFCRNHLIDIPPYNIECDYIPKKDAASKEGEILDFYVSNGYTPINKKKTGGLGGHQRYEELTINELKLVANTYKNRSDWRNNDYPTYYYAKTRGLLDTIKPKVNKRRLGAKKYYTYEKCQEIVNSYPTDLTVNEFRKFEPSCYTKIYSNGWNELLNRFVRVFQRVNFTINEIKEKIHTYDTIKEFMADNRQMYDYLIRHGIKPTSLLDEEKQKRSRTKNVHRCPVLQLDKETNEIIGKYPSMKDAAKAVGGTNKKISAVCCGKQKTAYGFKWIKYVV